MYRGFSQGAALDGANLIASRKIRARDSATNAKIRICDKVQIVRLSTGKRAALVQNIIPCMPRYIDERYYNRHTGRGEAIDKEDLYRVCDSARKLIVLHRCSPKCGFIFTDIFRIASALLQDVRERKAMNNSFEYDLKG